MPWPTPTDYRHAIQNPDSALNDEELRHGEVNCNSRGLPMLWAGNFASVYRIHCPATGKTWALKCFNREDSARQERYQHIAAGLETARLPFTVPFVYLERGIQIHGQWYPAVKMEWVEGQTLNRFVEDSLEKPKMLRQLLDLWPKLAARLRDAEIAHADLQHGNVLLVPMPGGKLALRLIDYDGMYMHALAGTRSGEVGHPNYQHPQRQADGIYNVHVDRFSHLVIFSTVHCLLVGRRDLWKRFNDDENLLFAQKDFERPGASPVIRACWELQDPNARSLVGRLVLACRRPLSETPLLQQVLAKDKAIPLTPPERRQVETILADDHAGEVFPAATATATPTDSPQDATAEVAEVAASAETPIGPADLDTPAVELLPVVKTSTHAAGKSVPMFRRMAAKLRSSGSAAVLLAQRWDRLLATTLGEDNAIVRYFLHALTAVVPLVLLGIGASLLWHRGGRSSEVAVTQPSARTANSEPPAEQPKEISLDLGGGVKLEMVLIPAGEFMMGSPDSEKDVAPDEKPQHLVRITRPFYLGKYEVTQEQWAAVMGGNPSQFKGPRNPVDYVSWINCQTFLGKLNAKIGGEKARFVLPTEAQWEYACRAGSTTTYAFGDAETELVEYGWYDRNSHGTTHPVGEKRPNAWGLYDMHGNVGEWCTDRYDDRYFASSPTDDPPGAATGPYRVRLGGCWAHRAELCRSACRDRSSPDIYSSGFGFRVARVMADDAASTSPMRLQPIAAQTVEVGKTLDFVATVENVSSAAKGLQFAIVQGAPPGATINTSTGRFTWTPSQEQPGAKFDVTVSVRNPDGGSDRQSFNITVVAAAKSAVMAAPGHPTLPDLKVIASIDRSVAWQDDRQYIRSVAIRWPFLYIQARSGDLCVCELSENGQVHPITTLEKAGDGNDLVILKDTLFCTNRGGLSAFGLPKDGKPVLQGRVPSVRRHTSQSIVPDGNRVFVVGDDNVSVFDISRPESPEFRASHSLDRRAWNGCVVGGYLYLAIVRQYREMSVPVGISVRDVSNMREVAFLETPASFYHLLPAQHDMLVGFGDKAMVQVDIANPSKPMLVDTGIKLSARTGGILANKSQRILVAGWEVCLFEDRRLRAVSRIPCHTPIDAYPFHAGRQGQYLAMPGNKGVTVVRLAETADTPAPEKSDLAPTVSPDTSFDLGGGVKLEMVRIPAGEFMMGSPDSDKDAGDPEKPQHKVRITRPFYLGKYLVTREQWEAVMGSSRCHFIGKKNPVDSVSWDDCQRFLDKLNEKSGPGRGKFRLPTEAQWEYACRAGNMTRFCFGDEDSGLDEYAWNIMNAGNTTRPVGEKRPNAWGLYDIHGNVWQWCADWYDGAYYADSPTDDPAGPATGSDRVSRGGTWHDPAKICRSAYRNHDKPGFRFMTIGLRVALGPVETVADGLVPDSFPVLKFRPIPARIIGAGRTLRATLTVANAEAWNGKLRYILGTGAPTGATIDAETGVFTWTPTEDQNLGEHQVKVWVEGPNAQRAETAFTVTVTRPPAQASADTSFDLGDGVKLEMVRIPAGDFTMGSPGNEGNEKPHQVRITRPFSLGKYEVTQEQWKAVMGTDPSPSKGPNLPVEKVSWNDCRQFLEKLNAKCRPEDGKFQLPTEAQWEYACRAGTTTNYCCGDDLSKLAEYAWFGNMSERNPTGGSHPVGEKSPNAWGLCDMHGNVSEWCQDWRGESTAEAATDPSGPATGVLRVSRGGSWKGPASDCQSAAHQDHFPGLGDLGQGFRVCRVSAEAVAEMPPPAQASQETSFNLSNGVKLEMVLIPAGEFMMGTSGDKDAEKMNRLPMMDVKYAKSHLVRITKAFYLGKYEVTQEQWKAVMGANPSAFKGPKNPVEQVSWDDCQKFLNKLNVKSSAAEGVFRLPTEAQWEYACRAGSKTGYCFGDRESALGGYAWYGANSRNSTHPVGKKKPNSWGLYDMHGNVYEWCEDWYECDYFRKSPTDDPTGPTTGSYRVFRGGNWANAGVDCRSAHRGFGELSTGSLRGFRVARVPAK